MVDWLKPATSDKVIEGDVNFKRYNVVGIWGIVYHNKLRTQQDLHNYLETYDDLGCGVSGYLTPADFYCAKAWGIELDVAKLLKQRWESIVATNLETNNG